MRYFNIFGPRQRPDSPYAAVIPKFAATMLQGGVPTIFGDGTQTRDFTHVANTVQGNLLVGACPKPLQGEVLNIACGKSHNLLDLIRMMAEILGVAPDYQLAPRRVGEILHSCANIDAAAETIGYRPVMQFEAGLQNAVESYAAGTVGRVRGPDAMDVRNH